MGVLLFAKILSPVDRIGIFVKKRERRDKPP